MSQRRPRGGVKRKRRRLARRSQAKATSVENEIIPEADEEQLLFEYTEAGKLAQETPRDDEAEILGAKRATDSGGAFGLWQGHPEIIFCTGLFSFGTTSALMCAIDETVRHLRPNTAMGVVGATLCLGIVLGFLLPHRIITQRLHDNRHSPPGGGGAGASLEFAAAMAGGALVGFGVLLGLLTGTTAALEQYRGWLVENFTYPPGLTLTALSAPVTACVFITGICISVSLTLLHGWRRAARVGNSRPGDLWTSGAIGAAAAGLCFPFWGAPLLPVILAPLSLFIAGVLAAARRTHTTAAAPAALNWARPTREEWSGLTSAGLVACALGACAAACGGVYSPGTFAGAIAGAGSGVIAGLTIGKVLPREGVCPMCLLLCAATTTAPFEITGMGSGNAAILRLFATTTAASACLTTIATGMAGESRNMQRSLAWIGGATAAGLGAAFATAFHYDETSTVSGFATTVCTAAAIFLTLFEQRGARLRRPAVLAAAGLLLFLTPAAKRELASSEGGGSVPPLAAGFLAREARALTTTSAFRSEVVRLPEPYDLASPTWRFDLAGPALDMIVVTSDEDGNRAPLPAADCRRLLKRLSRRMARGGRLLAELPTAEALERLLKDGDAWIGELGTVYLLTLRDDYNTLQALVCGADIAELVERNRRLTAAEVTLERIIDEGER